MHTPVLLNEVLKYFNPRSNENFIDCTIGSAGHAIAILEKTKPKGKILGIDWDEKNISELKQKFNKLKNRLILINDSYVNLLKIIEKTKFRPVKGILIDLGMSSWHLEKSKRGFSFQKDEFLDMRYNDENNLTAFEIINHWSKEEIEKILKEYSEERFAKKIVTNIIEKRKIKPIKTTFDLVEIIKQAVPKWYLQLKIHPATKTFQALRIAINHELENLEKVLPQAIEVLDPKGKLIVISYHSFEDRMVKNFFKKEAKDCICPSNFPQCVCQHRASLKIINKKPIIPSKEEIKKNSRSRSAKMRIIEKI